MKQSSVVTSVFQGVLVAIASISLLVGGIGIMNIMLVSVTERTREIGLRMALGAKRGDIRNQFLVEAAVLCVIGGGIGLALAAGLSIILASALDFPVVISLSTAIGSMLFSAFIGLAFGSYAAKSTPESANCRYSHNSLEASFGLRNAERRLCLRHRLRVRIPAGGFTRENRSR